MAEKIQWHPGFYAGMELELKAFDLSFDSESSGWMRSCR